VFLAANYYLMTAGIHLSGPSNAAVLIQLAPLVLVLVGVFAFGEGLTRRQFLGIVIAGLGFLLFYKDNLQSASDANNYSWAGINVVLAALAWVAFMICQKILIPRYSPQALNLIVYGVAGLILLPFVEWSGFSHLSLGGFVLLILLGLNTVFAYGALAEAVQRIPLTLISVITALNPLITLMGMKLLSSYFPGNLEPGEPSAMGYWGALLAVTGVVTVVTQKAARKIS
jgi:drug/metabolite transporter (DMT)-like permease